MPGKKARDTSKIIQMAYISAGPLHGMHYQALVRGSSHEAGGGPENINFVCMA